MHWVLTSIPLLLLDFPRVYEKLALMRAVWAGETSCGALRTVFETQVHMTGTDAYEDSRRSLWSAQAQSVHPSCFIYPSDAAEVSQIVYMLMLAGKKWPGRANFAVKSGGHSPGKSFASIENGVTMDLSSLNHVVVSADRTTVALGPGAIWQDVYMKLDALGLATSGGRLAQVGVGGLVLGGGLSFFSPHRGWVCDDVVNYEVVTSSGHILQVNEHNNKDLFRALCGGSNNFGIVTNFDMLLFPQTNFWAGDVFSGIEHRHEHALALEKLARSEKYDEYATMIYTVGIESTMKTWFIANHMAYTKCEPEPDNNPEVFRPFTGGRSVLRTTRVSNLTDFTIELGATSPAGFQQVWASTTVSPSAALMDYMFEVANATVWPTLEASGMVFVMVFQPMPPALSKRSGADVFGLGQDGPLLNLHTPVFFDDVKDTALVESVMHNFWDKTVAKAKELGVHHDYQYLNYAASWQDPISSYGAKSVAELKRVSRKYDPIQMFQDQVPGGFKLPRSTQRPLKSLDEYRASLGEL